MIRIESVRFEHNRIIAKLNDGRVELRHLLNWPILFPLPVEVLENNEIVNDRIVWPLLKFELNLTQILRARKR
jgi:hypothetical protein